ncbi:hypothetical protein ABLN64_02285 [Mycobacterium tuberculosis]
MIARHQGATRDDAGDTGQPDPLPHVAHPDRLYPPMVKRRTKNAKAFHDKCEKLTRVWKSFWLNTQI